MIKLAGGGFPTPARGEAYLLFAEGECAPLLHQPPLSPLAVTARASHRERASQKPHATSMQNPTFAALTPPNVRAGCVSRAGAHPHGGQRSLDA
eukprot:2963888-Prymnesium_polylepis.1